MSEAETGWYNELMAEHHSLGVAASGRVLRYAAEMDGVPLVLATFGSAAWRVPVRDGVHRVGPGPARGAAGAGVLQPAAVRAVGSGGGSARGVAGAGADAAPAAGRSPSGVRGAAGSGGVAHRPAGPRRDDLRGVRVHAGRADRRVRAVPRRGAFRASRAAEGVLDPGAGARRAGGAGRGVRLPAADRPDRPGLQGGPAVRGGLGLRGGAVRRHDAAGGAAPLRDPVQPPARQVRAAQPQDDQAGRPQGRRAGRRRADVRLAARRSRRRTADMAAHRHRRQDPARRPRACCHGSCCPKVTAPPPSWTCRESRSSRPASSVLSGGSSARARPAGPAPRSACRSPASSRSTATARTGPTRYRARTKARASAATSGQHSRPSFATRPATGRCPLPAGVL